MKMVTELPCLSYALGQEFNALIQSQNHCPELLPLSTLSADSTWKLIIGTKGPKLFHLHSFGLIAISEMLFCNAAAGIYVDPIDWPDCRHSHQTFNTPDFQNNRHLPHKTSTTPDLHHNILCGKCLVWWISCVVNVLLDTWWMFYFTHTHVLCYTFCCKCLCGECHTTLPPRPT